MQIGLHFMESLPIMDGKFYESRLYLVEHILEILMILFVMILWSTMIECFRDFYNFTIFPFELYSENI